VALSTPALFRDLAAAATAGAAKEGASPEALLRALQAGEAGGDKQRLPGETAYVNDLHAAALRCSREVAAVAARLREHEGFGVVRLSGAGPALFALGRPARGEEGGWGRWGWRRWRRWGWG